jgi:hypothetical protein
MPPVTERTMFPYRRDEARREREAGRAAAARQDPPQYDPNEWDTSTYPPSPWPAGGRPQRAQQTGSYPVQSTSGAYPVQSTGPYPVQNTSGSYPVQSTSGSYPAPPRPPLTRGPAAAAPSWVQQQGPTPGQPVPTRPGQSRGAQARVAQTGVPEAPQRSPWPVQHQQQAAPQPQPRAPQQHAPQQTQPRPVAQPGPRYEPDHTGQTGPHTWPPISREPELDEATQLASVQELRPKPALPEFDDRVAVPTRAPVEDMPDPRRAAKAVARKAAEDTGEFAADYSRARQVEPPEQERDEPAERSLLSAWLVFVLETVVAAGVGLSAWIGFHYLWRTYPLAAAGGCAFVLVGLHAVVGFIRRRQTGHAMDLFSSCMVVAVGVAITVLPAAFAIKPT